MGRILCGGTDQRGDHGKGAGMITDKEKRILDYVYGQAENCMAFLRDNKFLSGGEIVSFTVSRETNYINVTVSYYGKDNGCTRSVSRSSNRYSAAKDRETVYERKGNEKDKSTAI